METTQVYIDEWIDKQNVVYLYLCLYLHTHTEEYYSALKTKEISTHATTWMNLESMILSEISQSQKLLDNSTYMKNLLYS